MDFGWIFDGFSMDVCNCFQPTAGRFSPLGRAVTPALRAQYGAPRRGATAVLNLCQDRPRKARKCHNGTLGWPRAFRRAKPFGINFSSFFRLRFWHAFFPAFFAFLDSLWLPVGPFWQFWIDFGIHFGSLLAYFGSFRHPFFWP